MRYLLIALVLIPVLGIITGLIYLNSAAFRNLALRQVNAALDGRLIAGGHRISLASGKLILNAVRLQSADGQPLAQVRRLEVRIILADLLRRTIHIPILNIDNPLVYLTYDDQDRLRLVGPAPGAAPAPDTGDRFSPWQVIVDDYRLNDGQVIFQRPARNWSGRVEKLALAGDADLARRKVRLQLSAGPLVWQKGDLARSLPTMNAEVRWHGDRESTVTVKTTQSSFNARGRITMEDKALKLNAAADLDLGLEELRSWLKSGIRLEGRGQVHVAVHGPVDNPAAELHLALPRGNIAGIAVSALKTDLTYAAGKIAVQALQAGDSWGTLAADGVVDLSAGRIEQGKAKLVAASLTDLGRALGVELPAGSGTVKLSCEGPWQGPTGRAEILAENLTWRQFGFGRLLAAAHLDAGGVVTFSNLVLQNQGSLVEGRGRVMLRHGDGRWRSDPGLDLTLNLQNINPADFNLSLPVEGALNAHLDVGGSAAHLQGTTALDKSVVRWNELAFDLQGAAVWKDGFLNVSELRLSRDAAAAKLQGSVRMRDPGSGQWRNAPLIQADMSTRGVRLQDFFKEYSGAVTLQARVKGTPADLNGSFQLAGSDLELAGQPLAAMLFKGRLSKQIVHLDTVKAVVAGDQKIQGRGWYALDQRFELALASAGIDLAHIPSLQRAYPVDGLLVLDLQGRGSLQKPVITARLSVRHPRLNGQPWNDFHVKADLRERLMDLDADLNFTLTAHASLDSGDFNITAGLQDADLSPYLALAGGADWSGKLSGRLQAGGNWRRTGKLQAELDIAEALLRYQNLDLVSARKLIARLRDGRLEIPATRIEVMQNGFLSLKGGGDLRKDLHLTADGRLPMVALAPFSDLLSGARGELAFQAQIRGPLDALQWQADVRATDVACEIPSLGQQIEELAGRIVLEPGQLSVEQVTGRLDTGRFNIEGRLVLKDFKPAGGQLSFKAHSLPLQWPGTIDAVVNADLTLENSDNQSTLSGRVVLLEGTYYKNVRLNLLSAVTQPRRGESVPSTYDLPPALAGIHLNVSLTYRDPLLVDNNLARMQVAPDLKVAGTLQRPVISGRAYVSEGEVIFRQKTFTIKRGIVDFINPYKIEPTLDIAAEAQIRSWLVTLNLSGTPDRLLFSLSSDPSETESDILSLILLGRTTSELADGQSGGGQSTRQMLTALVATAWGEDVKKTTGVDILEVGTGPTDTSADTIQVTVGKKLSRRLTIKYEVQSSSEELVQKAVSEYRFLEHLLASGFQDSLGGYGGELLFRIEF